jgi:hypothetical protein
MPPLRKLTRRETALVALTAFVIVASALWWSRSPAGRLLVRAPSAADAPSQPIPRIDLARLDRPRIAAEAGRRSLFDFGSDPAPPTPPPAQPTPRPPGLPGPGGPGGAPGSEGPGSGLVAAGPPPLPPLNVRYIGSVENSDGIRVAVLVTDRQEILTGQQGQVVANRYRISKIGLESVDLEDVNTGQSRRVALRGS